MAWSPPWKRAKPAPEAEPVDEMAALAGFQVVTFEELPADMQARIIARKSDRAHPDKQDSDYEVLRW